jgi:DNA-binding PucR family transcriptional regulator
MTSLLDSWRAVDPEARLVSGSIDRLGRSVRGVARTRATAPHLPELVDGDLLVVDPQLLGAGGADELVAAVSASAVELAGIWIGATDRIEPAGSDLPILAGPSSAAAISDGVRRYLDAERDALAAVATEVRLAGAEAALVDPEPAAPAGVVAARLQRGVAVSVDRALVALTPRSAGRALATRFAAAHARLLSGGAPREGAQRRTKDGLWVLDRTIGDGATAWLFDDLPFAAVDEVALGSLAITLRALLRRRPAERGRARATPSLPPSSGDPLRDTLLAVARANGRIAPAARSLGVHRNTVLYRLRRAAVELGIDPRRPADALRLLQDVELRD